MKKFLVGCLLFVVLAGVAIAVGGYFFVYRPVAAFVTNAQAFAEWQAGVTNQTPYTPPADNQLTEAQVTSVVAVFDAMAAVATEDLSPLVGNLQRLQNEEIQDPAELWTAVSQLGTLLQTAAAIREAQVAAINARGMSVQEYEWARSTVVVALIPTDRLAELQNAATSGQLTPERVQELLNAIGQQGGAAPAAGEPAGAPATAPAVEQGGKPGVEAAPAAVKPGGAPAAGAATGTTNALPTSMNVHNASLVAPYRDRAAAWVPLFVVGF
jgi:hypothetical protein